MPTEPTSRRDRLFDEARALPPGDRAAYLARACPDDPELRDEVLSLVEADAAAAGFFEGLSRDWISPLRSAGVGRGVGAPPGLPVGSKVARYEIVGVLGEVGMGEVYRARDPDLERDVSLKLLPPHAVGSPEARAELMAEARRGARLDHPHVGVIHEVGETPDAGVYLAMACHEGETLADRLRRGPLSLPTAEVLRIGRGVASALEAAHEAGVHRAGVHEAHRVLVLPFEDRTDDPALASLGIMAADWIAEGIARAGVANVVDRAGALFAYRETADPVALATLFQAGIVVAGHYQVGGDSIRLQARLVDGVNGTILRSLATVTAAREAPGLALEPLRQAALSAVALHLAEALLSLATELAAELGSTGHEEAREAQALYREPHAINPHFIDPPFGLARSQPSSAMRPRQGAGPITWPEPTLGAALLGDPEGEATLLEQAHREGLRVQFAVRDDPVLLRHRDHPRMATLLRAR